MFRPANEFIHILWLSTFKQIRYLQVKLALLTNGMSYTIIDGLVSIHQMFSFYCKDKSR